MDLFKKSKQPKLLSLEEEIRIFQEKFSNFGMRLKLEEVKENGWARIFFRCDNIQQYIIESQEARKIIEEGLSSDARKNQIKANYDVDFELDCVTISDMRRSYYDYTRHEISYRTHGLFGSTGGIQYTDRVAVRRIDFLFSDKTGRFLSCAEVSNSPDKTWSAIMFSEKSDIVRVNLSYVFGKEDEKDLSFSQLYRLRNYSLETRLNK